MLREDSTLMTCSSSPGVNLLEPISKSSEEDNEAGELDEAKEVIGVIFPADEDTTLPLYPSRKQIGCRQSKLPWGSRPDGQTQSVTMRLRVGAKKSQQKFR